MLHTVNRRTLVAQLRAIGVRQGSVLVVHTAFSKVCPVEDGPLGVIDALRDALGPAGTLVMPSMSDDDDRPFEPRETPCRSMGIVADTFWRLPDVLRSDSPHAFAAIGPHAAEITAPHPVHTPHGSDSPVGRVHALDGDVLLLGAGHDANTTIHLAENLAGVRYRSAKYAMVREGGRVVRCDYEEADHCCANFALMDGWLDSRGLQRRGIVGHAEARLMLARDIVEVATSYLRSNEAMFLHERGTCPDCDDAWRSL